MEKNSNKKAITKKREQGLEELDRIAKMLVRRDLELMETRERREKEVAELDRIAKLLVRRDLQLTETREKRERELQELKETKGALMNMLEDVEAARIKLEEERDKTLSLIANFTDGILFFDKENKIVLINPPAENLLKVRAENLIEKSLLTLSEIPKLKDLVGFLCEPLKVNPVRNSISNGVKDFRPQRQKIRKISRQELLMGESLVLEISTVPIEERTGERKERMGTLIILHDITREKRIEKMKTEFVSVAAHQLRTPLSAVKWVLRMILDEEFGKIPKDQVEILQKAYKSNERMIGLINDLLDVARIEEGRYLYELIFSKIEPVIHLVVDSYKEEIQEKGLIFEFRGPAEELPEIKIDVAKIKLVIQNLIDNAIKYTSTGGKVTISLRRVNKEIECSVADTGVGIPKSEQDRMFTKFFRGANIIKMQTEGSGLGLFITKNIIEAHNGRIWFESEEGKGTTFHFTLPIK